MIGSEKLAKLEKKLTRIYGGFLIYLIGSKSLNLLEKIKKHNFY